MTHRHDTEVAIEVGVVPHPRETKGILLQLPDGYVVMRTCDARTVAANLLEAADEADVLRGSL